MDNLVYNTSKWSDYLFNSIVKKERILGKLVKSFNDSIGEGNQGKTFAKEIFSRMYEEPEKKQKDICNWAEKGHDIASGSKGFNSLSVLVKDDKNFSAMATVEILNQITPELIKLFEVQKEHETNQTEKSKQQLEDLARSIRVGIRNANNKLSPEIKEIMGAMSAFGHGNSRASETDRSDIIKILQYNKKLREVMHKAGRLLNIVDSLPAKDETSESISTIEMGNNLKKVLPIEYTYLADSLSEDIFYKKYIDRQLLQFAGVESKLGRGPVVVLVDESGSMNGPPDILAKSIASAIGLIAMKNDRYFHCATFDTRINFKCEIYNKVGTIISGSENKQYSGNVVLAKLASQFNGGGTNFDIAMDYAIRKIQSQKNADIIFMTDGHGVISEKNLSEIIKAKENGLRIFTILIGVEPSEQIKSISNSIVDIFSITGALENNKEATDKLCNIIKNSTEIK